MDKDTVWGPFHTNDVMRVSGKPTFYGKVTNLKGIQKADKNSNPNFFGGYETGVDLPIPTNGVADVKKEADAGGKTLTGNDTVYVNFVSDSIKIKYSFKGVETSYLATIFFT